MEIKCQLAILKCFSCQGEYLLKTEKETVRKGVRSGGLVGAGVKETSLASTKADGNEQLRKKVAILLGGGE